MIDADLFTGSRPGDKPHVTAPFLRHVQDFHTEHPLGMPPLPPEEQSAESRFNPYRWSREHSQIVSIFGQQVMWQLYLEVTHPTEEIHPPVNQGILDAITATEKQMIYRYIADYLNDKLRENKLVNKQDAEPIVNHLLELEKESVHKPDIDIT